LPSSAINGPYSGVAGIARDNGGYAGIFAARCAAGENAGKHGCRLSFLEVTTEEHRQDAAALPERAIERAATQHHSIACLGSFLITVTLYKRWPPHHEISLDRVERMGDLSAGKSRKFTFSRRYNPEKVSPFVTTY
jgi:hypothetical protein